MSERIVIVGATSGIARALARVLAARGCRLLLAGRNAEELHRLAAGLAPEGQSEVLVERFDALDLDRHPEFVERCLERLGGLDGVVLCHGFLPAPGQAESDPAVLRQTLEVNFTSAAVLLQLFAGPLARQGHGFLAAVSSVAGDRGRQSNYAYGAAKAGLTAFLQGLRNRLHHQGVRVLTIKPGYVDTPMIHGRVNPRSPLVASPERVARDIDRALRQRHDVLYTPWFWRYVMTAVCAIPEGVFKRLKL